MAAIDFPSSPSNGDTHTVGGVTYTYNSAETKWKTTINSNNFLPLTGGTLSGNLNMGTNDLTVGDVTASGTASLSGLTYPTSDGTSGQYLQTNGSGALSFATVNASNLTRMTEVPTTSGVEIDVTGIPSGVRKITITFDHVRNNGTDRMRLQIGDSGGIETTGYDSGVAWEGSGGYPGLYEDGSGFAFCGLSGAGYEVNGTLTLLNASGNKWVGSWVSYAGSYYCQFGGGTKTLSGELTQLRIENTGTNTFNLGNLTVFYEV